MADDIDHGCDAEEAHAHLGEVSHKLLGYLIAKFTGRKYYKKGCLSYFGYDEPPKKFE